MLISQLILEMRFELQCKLIKMGRGKNWNAQECEAGAKAYLKATLNPVKGVQQRSEDFSTDILVYMRLYKPAGADEPGRYEQRGTQATWNYIRDTILPQCQKFSGFYNRILAMKLTGGLSEDNIINIAVAKYKGAVKEGESLCDYKDFDSNGKWICYRAWLVLKDTDKCRLPGKDPLLDDSSDDSDEEQQEDEQPTAEQPTADPDDAVDFDDSDTSSVGNENVPPSVSTDGTANRHNTSDVTDSDTNTHRSRGNRSSSTLRSRRTNTLTSRKTGNKSIVTVKSNKSKNNKGCRCPGRDSAKDQLRTVALHNRKMKLMKTMEVTESQRSQLHKESTDLQRQAVRQMRIKNNHTKMKNLMKMKRTCQDDPDMLKMINEKLKKYLEDEDDDDEILDVIPFAQTMESQRMESQTQEESD